MTNPDRDDPIAQAIKEAIANAAKFSQDVADEVKSSTAFVGESVGVPLYQFIERGTQTIGNVVNPIANNPLVQFATRVPVLSWLAAALGQVNVDAVQREVDELRQKHPTESAEQLAQRVMVNTAWKAAGIGLVTNALPPLALTLFAVDLGAIAALQAEMIYRVATIYGFSPTDPTRRGEVLALWGLSTGSSGVLKTALSAVELLPGIGAVLGVTGDAGLLLGMGYLACQFYEEKRRQQGGSFGEP